MNFNLANTFMLLNVLPVFATTAHGAKKEILNLYQGPQVTPKVSRCGASYNSATGGIYYKPFETILKNERCVWLVGVPSARWYGVNIQSLGNPTNQPNSGQGLIVTGMGLNTALEGIPRVVHHTPTSQGIFTVASSNLLVITFYSSDVSFNGTSGFALLWEAYYNGTAPQSSTFSSHHLLESPVFDFRYPILPINKYSRYELSSFVFPPAGNIYNAGNDKYTFLNLLRLRVFSSTYPCGDAVYIYNFNVTGKTWNSASRVCHTSKTTTIANNDLTLLVFQTTVAQPSSETENGFQLSYSAC